MHNRYLYKTKKMHPGSNYYLLIQIKNVSNMINNFIKEMVKKLSIMRIQQ